MDTIIRRIRGLAWSQGKAPVRLCEGVEKIREIGNNIGMDGEEFQETAEWIAEECEEELEENSGGSQRFLSTLKGLKFYICQIPREYTSNPGLLEAYLKFFAHVNVRWTLSSRVFDITNWPYYLGDQDDAVALVRAMVDETRRLGAEILLSTECGHGFKILKKDAETWLGEKIGFEVLSIVELAHQVFKEGRLKIKRGRNRAIRDIS